MERIPWQFAKIYDKMIGTSDSAYKTNAARQINSNTKTAAEISTAIANGTYEELLTLSQNFRVSSGMYQRILFYFSNLLTYDTYVSPKKLGTKTVKQTKYLENYKASCYFVDNVVNPQLNFSEMIFTLLQDGAYYGLFLSSDDYHAVFKKLPSKYCRTRFRSYSGNHLLEFDMAFFDTITNETLRLDVLKNEFGKDFVKGYSAYKKDATNNKWMIVPEEIGVAFYFIDSLKPLFMSTIAAIARLNEYKDIEQDLDSQALDSLLVEKVPQDKEGNFLLEPDEVTEFHNGIVKMLGGQKHINVLTTPAETLNIRLGERSKAQSDNLAKVERSVYQEAGVSQQIFDADSSQALAISIMADMSLMLNIVKQFDNWLTYQVNIRFSEKSKYFFEVSTLPITHYNRKDVLALYLKNAEFGYSKILPAIASGMKQSAFLDMAELENDILKLGEVLVPLQSAHTASNKEAGAPTKNVEDKAKKTVQNQEGA